MQSVCVISPYIRGDAIVLEFSSYREDLRGDIIGCSHGSGTGDHPTGVHLEARTKVSQTNVSILIDQDIVRFDVSVRQRQRGGGRGRGRGRRGVPFILCIHHKSRTRWAQWKHGSMTKTFHSCFHLCWKLLGSPEYANTHYISSWSN